MTSTATGTRTVPATPDQVRALLLDPLKLPAWNPAFLSVAGPRTAAAGQDYDLRTLPNLHGALRYTEITRDRIRMEWTVPGMREQCEWVLHDAGGAGTRVDHAVTRSGPFAAVLRHALADLPGLRLDRLAETAPSASPAPTAIGSA
ncbi:SRPBCC family protein [Streptomyces sp. NBC_00433]